MGSRKPSRTLRDSREAWDSAGSTYDDPDVGAQWSHRKDSETGAMVYYTPQGKKYVPENPARERTVTANPTPVVGPDRPASRASVSGDPKITTPKPRAEASQLVETIESVDPQAGMSHLERHKARTAEIAQKNAERLAREQKITGAPAEKPKPKKMVTKELKFKGTGPDDPEADTFVGDIHVPDPEPERTRTATADEPTKGRAKFKPSKAESTQKAALEKGSASDYWLSTIGKESKPKEASETTGRTTTGPQRKYDVVPQGAVSDLGVKNEAGKDVGGFCTNCDKPIPGVQAATPVGQRRSSTGHMITVFAESNKGHDRGIFKPRDDTLCAECTPMSQTLTAEGANKLAEKFNVSRTTRG
jgi:hypothetical protein